jgi:hypothetical protein
MDLVRAVKFAGLTNIFCSIQSLGGVFDGSCYFPRNPMSLRRIFIAIFMVWLGIMVCGVVVSPSSIRLSREFGRDQLAGMSGYLDRLVDYLFYALESFLLVALAAFFRYRRARRSTGCRRGWRWTRGPLSRC